MFNFFHKKDDQIQTDVRSELAWDPSIEAAHIDVKAKDGTVTLSGNVPHYYDKYNAEEAAHRVGGVKIVEDKIEVKPETKFTRSDGQIAEAARLALEWSYQVPAGITADVENGWITLSGKVDWNYERDAATLAVAKLIGVRGVDNDIAIKTSRVEPAVVRGEIQEALKRSAAIEGRSISVEVEGSTVTLTGSLDSYNEIETARVAAWNSRGVGDVVNNLRLSQ